MEEFNGKRHIGCCGTNCYNCRALTNFMRKCMGCKGGYDTGERNINSSGCKIKLCCFRDKNLEVCGDCSDVNKCKILNANLSSRNIVIEKGRWEPLSIEKIQNKCINEFYKKWAPKINNHGTISSHYQSYIVLHICRILCTLYKFELVERRGANDWVKNNLSEWKEIIEEAEKWKYTKKMDKEKDVIKFIEFAEKEME